MLKKVRVKNNDVKPIVIDPVKKIYLQPGKEIDIEEDMAKKLMGRNKKVVQIGKSFDKKEMPVEKEKK